MSRDALRRKLDIISPTLRARHPQYANAFGVDETLDVLYDIGFLGVVRNDSATYVQEDPLRIERHETQFVIHPCFREALQSVSSVDVRPYEPAGLRSRVLAERGIAQIGDTGLRRGHRSYRVLREVRSVCDRVLRVVEESSLPREAKVEVRRSIRSMARDIDTAIELPDDWDYSRWTTVSYGLVQSVLRYFQDLENKLHALCLLANDDGDVGRVVSQSVKTLKSLRSGELWA